MPSAWHGMAAHHPGMNPTTSSMNRVNPLGGRMIVLVYPYNRCNLTYPAISPCPFLLTARRLRSYKLPWPVW